MRSGGVQPATVHVSDGVIARVGDYDDVPRGASTIDAGDLVVLPGLVDTHVHINEPGRSDWEGFEHATRAAAAGGVTTLVDMPLNSVPPTTSVAGFEAKLLAADGRCHVDVGFWGGVVPGNADALEPLAARGALGFKCFLSPSGVDEFPHVNEADLRAALPVVARLGLPLLAHAELPARLREPGSQRDPRDYRTWLESRPAESETAAIDLLIQLAAEYGAHVHIVHLASADALSRLSAAREKGVRVTVETCPHYLSFAAEEIAKGATPFKCAPPIRERSVDIVLMSQVAHHFTRDSAIRLVRTCDALARVGVVIADLRRGPLAPLAFRIGATALRFDPVTRADGLTSLRRGYTAGELRDLLLVAGVRARVARRPGYRLVATWRTDPCHPERSEGSCSGWQDPSLRSG